MSNYRIVRSPMVAKNSEVRNAEFGMLERVVLTNDPRNGFMAGEVFVVKEITQDDEGVIRYGIAMQSDEPIRYICRKEMLDHVWNKMKYR